MGLANKDFRRGLAVATGVAFALLSFDVGQLSWASANPVIGAVQWILMVLIIPGLIGSAGISGNVHAFALWPAALINGVLYFGIASGILAITAKIASRD